MTAAPSGQKKADAENTDPVVNAQTAKKSTAKRSTGSKNEQETLPHPSPESVSKPGDEQRPAEEDNATPTGVARPSTDPNKEGEAQFEVPPAVPGPNDPVPEGQVQVTKRAEEGKPSDPGGNLTEARKTSKRTAPKKDSLAKIEDYSKLPVAVTVGQIVASVEEYAGNAVLSLSLVGWVGDAPLKIRASDIGELEQALAELRKELS